MRDQMRLGIVISAGTGAYTPPSLKGGGLIAARSAPRRWLGFGIVATMALLVPAAAAMAAPPYPDAVVLVSGFDTQTPFTTPDPSCDGQEGPEWNPPTGIAAALKAAGEEVFTAPVKQASGNGLPPCNPDGPAPPQGDYINSNGEVDANGQSLAGFLAFLRDNYGVERAQLVGHSDGGLWARSAITQDGAYSRLAIPSLTTLGTPHTGSFVADLAIEVQGGKCDFTDEILQDLCGFLQGSVDALIDDIGQATTEELTNGFLATWNPQQTIGSCPVTGIAGTFVDLPLIPFTYYNPNDGLVGEASALARNAYDIDLHPIPAPPIPDFRDGGTFPVVHGSSVSFLSKDTLLNTQAISDDVVDIVDATPASGPLCNTSSPKAKRAAAAVHLRRPLARLVFPSLRGQLPAPNAEDALVVRRGFQVRCGHRIVPLMGLPGSRRLRTALLYGCDRRLRVRGKGRSPRSGALMIRRSRARDIALKVRDDHIRLRVRGPRVEHVRALARNRGKWRRVRLDQRGVGTLPSGATRTALRVRVRPRPRARLWTATAVVRH